MTFWETINKQCNRIDFKHIIALIIVAFTFHIFNQILFYQLTGTADKYASQIITGLIAILGTVLGYWFVASSSSAKKDATIAGMIQSPTTTNTTTTVLTLSWLGTFDSAPGNPAVNDAYINSIDKNNYYWDGTTWVITTQTP